MSETTAFVYGWSACALLMALLWIAQLRGWSSAVVDVAWAFATGCLAIWLVYWVPIGDPIRHGLLAVMIGVWSIRLTLHLAVRLGRERDDGRYTYFREVLGEKVHWGMLVFFQIQAIWAVMFAAPVWAAANAERGPLDWWDAVGVAVWLIAIGGEWLSDRQLSRFRSNNKDRNKVCREGLWRYSRHPNYFFEWLHWVAYLFVGLHSPYWWVCAAGVIFMYVFVTKVTGIPFTEKQALRSRGDAYRAYQRTTSAFFPLPPKQDPEETTP